MRAVAGSVLFKADEPDRTLTPNADRIWRKRSQLTLGRLILRLRLKIASIMTLV
jgi:hypothetical protein